MSADRGVAFVTGASSGIGRAAALRLAQQGYKVAASARRGEALAALAAEHAQIVSYPGDACDRSRMADIIAEIESRQGPIMQAFLNHGVYFPAERAGFHPDVAWRTFEVNVGGVLNCLAPLLDKMSVRGRGGIAITASLAGYGGVPGSMAYGASKAALIYMAEVLRMAYAPQGLNIQIVNPGFVATAMTEHADFDMPFLMDADRAARIICDGFASKRFEIAFPRRLALIFKAARLLPYPLLLPLMRRIGRRADGGRDPDARPSF